MEPKIKIIGKASYEKKEQVREEIKQALFNHFESFTPGKSSHYSAGII